MTPPPCAAGVAHGRLPPSVTGQAGGVIGERAFRCAGHVGWEAWELRRRAEGVMVLLGMGWLGPTAEPGRGERPCVCPVAGMSLRLVG